MTPDETKHWDSKFDEIKEILSDQNKAISGIKTEVDNVKRGVYGDPSNQVPGLIDYQKNHHTRIANLEDTKKKALWIGGGILTFLELGWHSIKEFFTK